jgi:hypothetical protein
MTTQTFSSIYNYTANVIAYDASTNIATLDNPIDISLGYNDIYGTVTSEYSIQGDIANISKAIQAGDGLPQLSTDEQGNFVGIFNVPPSTFQTGQRVFRVDNRSVDTDPTTATTYSEATFTASGLSTKSQQLNFSPSIDASATTFTQVNQLSNQLISSITTRYTIPGDPVAQSFIISKDNFPNGIFINSVKLFFYSKPTTNTPVKISIVGTLNGYPSGQRLDHSTVVLDANQVVTSKTPHYLDSTTYTEFMFEAPVYIQPGLLYAIVIESNSADYVLYYAQQNKTAVPSTAKVLPTDANPVNPTKIGSAPYVGALFESQNSITWTADQTKDLMFVIDRCVFNTSAQPKIPFVVPKNLPYRKLGIDDVTHKVDANSVSNLYGNYARESVVDAINVSTTDFIPSGTNIDYSYRATLLNGNIQTAEANITPGKFGTPTPENVYLSDGQGERVLLKNSNSSFSLFASLSSNNPDVSPIISDDGVSLYNIQYVINNMGIGNNVVSLDTSGFGYTAANTQLVVSSPDIGTDVAILGYELDANGSFTSVYVEHEGSGYLTTPTVTVIDTSNTVAHVLTSTEYGGYGGYFGTSVSPASPFIYFQTPSLAGITILQSIKAGQSISYQDGNSLQNVSYVATGPATYGTIPGSFDAWLIPIKTDINTVNNTIAYAGADVIISNTPATITIHGETSSTGGNSFARYFTKKVVLSEGNDSGDLRVFYTAYRPLGTNIHVYYKILNKNDAQNFDECNWQLMTPTTNLNVYSTSRTDMIEFECAPGTGGVADNTITYTNKNGQKFSSFNQFAIKIVMATNDNTSVPYLTDIRALALPSGTGL